MSHVDNQIFTYAKTGADQMCSNCTVDQSLFFRYTDSTILPLLIPKISRDSFRLWVYGCIDRFVSDLVGNLEDQFSRNEALIVLLLSHIIRKFALNICFRPGRQPHQALTVEHTS